ncbi:MULTISPECIES: zinc dependent phospholipase C family protein [unclassified Clostridium]|uniref:zinc dependent phospholipase C family protein n=1 Tax=unclassified Clostridium TaxID=2614128 RepID=UPI002907BC51|nr:zinc dependent phospholipase C family protein [Clostridium sp.]MDU5107997.1 zinc dependent phospholipase C family protein [Clostridium sp.]
MMMNTHKSLAVSFIKNVELDKKFLINDKHFVWGNLKPDSVSKYKFKKHYFDESINMIVNKILFLSSMTVDDIFIRYTVGKFNQELGVVCHFLCDYFCVPHYQRWEFKSPGAVKDHVLYENDLNKYNKSYNLKKEINTSLNGDDIRKYIDDLQEEYSGIVSYEKDLQYASHICNTTINLILDEVVLNQKIKENIALVI